MLTRKQHDLLLFIMDRLNKDGVSPSFEEMKVAAGLKSKSGIHRLIKALSDRGFIRHMPHRARAIDVIRLPDDQVSARAAADQTSPCNDFQNTGGNVIRGDFGARPRRETVAEIAQESVSIPLYGRIAAGTPTEALNDPSRHIDIPPSMLGRGNHYALKVDGDSMIEAGIHDGDTVVIESCNTADNGTIVVALVDNEEVTLKRLRRHGGSVALEPANALYKTRICGPDQVKVQGRLVGLIRRY